MARSRITAAQAERLELVHKDTKALGSKVQVTHQHNGDIRIKEVGPDRVYTEHIGPDGKFVSK